MNLKVVVTIFIAFVLGVCMALPKIGNEWQEIEIYGKISMTSVFSLENNELTTTTMALPKNER